MRKKLIGVHCMGIPGAFPTDAIHHWWRPERNLPPAYYSFCQTPSSVTAQISSVDRFTQLDFCLSWRCNQSVQRKKSADVPSTSQERVFWENLFLTSKETRWFEKCGVWVFFFFWLYPCTSLLHQFIFIYVSVYLLQLAIRCHKHRAQSQWKQKIQGHRR